MILHVVSFSSGKDSAATLELALQRFRRDRVIAIFCDTDNEDAAVYRHIEYTERHYGIKVVRLKACFDDELAAKRRYIARDMRTRREYARTPRRDRFGAIVYRKTSTGELEFDEKGEPIPRLRKTGGRRVRWSNKAKRRALRELHPSGNVFLDLCLWKGRFPSRKAQFCTQELKTALAVQFQQALVEQGHVVVSWQGVRRDESQSRQSAKRFERLQPRTYAFRPLVDWTAADVFDYLQRAGVEPNPLYREGMSRVGCMPCINANKPELREISVRRPGHIDRIGDWESRVSSCSKRGFSTFFADSHQAQDRREIFRDLNIAARVEWSKTTRGGRQFNLLDGLDEPDGCKSSYGLCEGRT